MTKKVKKRTRMPSSKDIDDRGMVRMQVMGHKGMKVKLVPAVDAREIILSDSGSLDIDDEVLDEANAVDRNLAMFQNMSLDELRELCGKNDLSYTGKPSSMLATMLVNAGVTPPEETEED